MLLAAPRSKTTHMRRVATQAATTYATLHPMVVNIVIEELGGAMRLAAIAILFLFVSLNGVQAQWCENDCVRLCGLTAAAPSECIAHYSCSQYAGRACAPKGTVERRARSNQSGGHLSFEACMRRGTSAGWGTAETSAYCNSHR